MLSGTWTWPSGPRVVAQNAVDAGRELVETGAVYLIIGGLVMLGLVVVLVLIRAAFPVGGGDAEQGDASGAHRMRSTPALDEPPTHRPEETGLTESARAEGAGRLPKGRLAHVNDVMAALEDQGWGEARLLAFSHGGARVRLYACTACRTDPGGGCGEPAGFLEAAFERLVKRPATVQETACGQGSAACDFEVAYAA